MIIELVNIKNLIQQGDLQHAIIYLIEITDRYSSRFHNEAILHVANLKQFQENERKGILSTEEIRRQKNRITYALLDLINEIDREIATKESTISPSDPKNNDKIIKILFLAANPSDTTRLRLTDSWLFLITLLLIS